VICVEDAFQHREQAFPWSPLPVDTPVPQPVPDAQRVTPHATPHGGVVAPGLDAEVALIPIHHLSRLG